MKIKYNHWLPQYLNVTAIVIGRKMLMSYPEPAVPTESHLRTIRHEKIHFEQMDRYTVVGFYILYGVIFLWEWAKRRNWDEAYRQHPFEVEAYTRAQKKDGGQ